MKWWKLVEKLEQSLEFINFIFLLQPMSSSSKIMLIVQNNQNVKKRKEKIFTLQNHSILDLHILLAPQL